MIEHLNVVRLMFNTKNPYDFKETDVWTLFHYFGFDFSVWEIWGALLFGGKLVIVPQETTKDLETFSDLIIQEEVTVLNQVPSTFEQLEALLLSKKQPLALRYIIFGGATLLPQSLAEFHQTYPNTRLINMYGITETTVHVTFKEITKKEITSGLSNIGTPIPTLNAYILDKNKNVCPIGVAGEICISGLGLARGYLNNPTLTDKKFIKNPFQEGERLYKSGDLGRWLPNGEMAFLGRIDHQLKIRGYRIEAGEIEQCLIAHFSIQTALVIDFEMEKNKELVAYLVPNIGENVPSITALKAFLGESLPDYMIPNYFIFLDKMPLTKNGKINRKTLPSPNNYRKLNTKYVAPRNAIEQQLTDIWQQVLNLSVATKISIQDDFFTLGGHSLRAIQLLSKAQEAFQRTLKLAFIFDNKTIEEQAKYLSKGEFNEFSFLDGIRFNEANQPTIFAFPAFFGLGIAYQILAQKLSGFSIYSFDFITNDDRLEHYYQQIKKQQPQGPYIFFGYSSGGNLAFEIAKYMEEKDETITAIILGDSPIRTENIEKFDTEEYLDNVKNRINNSANPSDLETQIISLIEQNEVFKKKVSERLIAYHRFLETPTDGKVQADIYLLKAEKQSKESGSPIFYFEKWINHTYRNFYKYSVKGEHHQLLDQEYLAENTTTLKKVLKDIQNNQTGKKELSLLYQLNRSLHVELLRLQQKRESILEFSYS